MKQIKFDSFVTTFLKEEPQTMPTTRPFVKPSAPPAPSKPRPSTPNPDPFRRHKPGQMPKQRPMASGNLKDRIQGIVNKYMTILEQ